MLFYYMYVLVIASGLVWLFKGLDSIWGYSACSRGFFLGLGRVMVRWSVLGGRCWIGG